MEKKFKIGDTVVLKSGGPTMTVTRYIYPIVLRGESEFKGTVECSWFSNNQIVKGDFPQDSLKIYINDDDIEIS